jgi:hypothetical protein
MNPEIISALARALAEPSLMQPWDPAILPRFSLKQRGLL